LSDISRFFYRNWHIFYQKSLVFQINVQIWSEIGRHFVRNWFTFLSEFCSSSSKFFLVLVDYWTKYDLTFCSLTTKFCLFLIDFLIDFVWFLTRFGIYFYMKSSVFQINVQIWSRIGRYFARSWYIFWSELVNFAV